MATKERLLIETLFQIADKEGNDVPFVLNSSQATLDTNLTGRDIIPKARQEGISSYFLARYTAKCLSKRNTRAVVISHEEKATQRMLAKVHYFLNNMRGPKAVIKNSSKNEITFPKMDSMFYIGTAGAKTFGRGDTITDLHCSEVAFWGDPKKLMTGLLQAVPKGGEIAIESTGNGVGNYYHKRCMAAAQGKGRMRLHFFNWIDFAEYTHDLTSIEEEDVLNNLDVLLEEPDLVEKFGLTAGQISWRREKLEELDFDLTQFKQEYPLTLDECFQASGRSIFQMVNFGYSPDWKRVSYDFQCLEDHPKTGHSYAIGGDVGAGIGQDNSVAEIICIDTMEQVAEFVSNRLAPDIFANKLASLGKHYNEAYQVIESNNHGILTLSELSKIYPDEKIFKTENKDIITVVDYGKRTTVKTKPLILGRLRKFLVRDLTIYSTELKGELSTFVEKENGTLEAEEGCNDDRVIALAMAMAEIEKAALILAPSTPRIVVVRDDFALDQIIEDMRRGSEGFPIAPQALNS